MRRGVLEERLDGRKVAWKRLMLELCFHLPFLSFVDHLFVRLASARPRMHAVEKFVGGSLGMAISARGQQDAKEETIKQPREPGELHAHPLSR